MVFPGKKSYILTIHIERVTEKGMKGKRTKMRRKYEKLAQEIVKKSRRKGKYYQFETLCDTSQISIERC